LIAFFYRQRRRSFAFSRERPVNVLHDEEDDNLSPHNLPHYHIPEPFFVIGGTSEVASTRDRTVSMTTADTPSPQTPVAMTAATNTTRKTGPLAQLRHLNIIQHDDAGPHEWPTSVGKPETIELPPAYTNIRSARRPPRTASTASTETTIS
jgi:hypothetical protein